MRGAFRNNTKLELFFEAGGGRFELFCLTSNKAKQGSKAKEQFALRQTRPNKALRQKDNLPYVKEELFLKHEGGVFE